MIITNTINTDLWIRERTQQIYAVQGDSCTRRITVKLFANRKPWMPGADISVAIRFQKPDGTGGSYDTLPDGEKAWEVTENAVSFVLAPQMLAVPGRVAAQVELLSDNGVLASFPLHILVEENVAAEITKSGNYFSWEQRLEWELDKTLEQAKQSGEFDGPVGATPNLQIGTVSTVEAGGAASAVIRGTPENPILDLALPKGADAVIDATLTQTGSAADAAATGTALAGKAPAGYGLGEHSVYAVDCHAIAENGWYFTDVSTLNAPPESQYGTILAKTRGEAIILEYTDVDGGKKAQAVRTSGGIWNEWEWVNPPMYMDTEYRTTERYNGSPVYVKAVDLGMLPNATEKIVPFNGGAWMIVDLTGFATNEGLFFDLSNTTLTSAFYATRNNIHITTAMDASIYSGYAIVKYTKG